MEYCPIVGNILHRDTAYINKKYISDELCIVKGSSSSNYPYIRLKSPMYEYQLELVPNFNTFEIY